MKYLLLALFLTNAYAGPVQDKNKQITTEFYELSFNKHKPFEAAEKYLSKKYIQHNPFVANGSDAFVNFFKVFFKANPKSSAEIKRTIADGDLVMLHVHSKKNSADPGNAVVDIFRLEDGKIVEHWDVIQPVVQQTTSGNTMF